jgi:hypothetical protein
MRNMREDPMLHCEGDTTIEDLFVVVDERAPGPEKKRKLAVRRRGPTYLIQVWPLMMDLTTYEQTSGDDKMTLFSA